MTSVMLTTFIDNTTAVTYVNKMGGTQSHACNEIAQNIWQWAITRNTWQISSQEILV